MNGWFFYLWERRKTALPKPRDWARSGKARGTVSRDLSADISRRQSISPRNREERKRAAVNRNLSVAEITACSHCQLSAFIINFPKPAGLFTAYIASGSLEQKM